MCVPAHLTLVTSIVYRHHSAYCRNETGRQIRSARREKMAIAAMQRGETLRFVIVLPQ